MYLNKPPFSYRNDNKIPDFADAGPICVMDAQCALCARGAKWIAHNDRNAEFRIVPLQSELGNALMTHYGMDPGDPTSWLYLVEGHGYASLDALIHVGQRLGRIWKVLAILRLVPSGLRDALYRAVARNRYRWFGTADLCSLPDSEVQKRLMT
ncbi:thiol-disulfide oxidoreductase DCC family protein [Parasedimentitalea maritima]|uniref:DUF393 domain-containing protein n=1 Tax=Parasedimentitalea maritima TaxID=2578117 RepID=A0A6A4RGP8_9RHOB|nr:DCC1-like thiol-disulfide oxidoreductase family protein [Zongyanglinia marina]KAE9629980.1 DUF393 domain-containing protein [Zongyanglinia marina]